MGSDEEWNKAENALTEALETAAEGKAGALLPVFCMLYAVCHILYSICCISSICCMLYAVGASAFLC